MYEFSLSVCQFPWGVGGLRRVSVGRRGRGVAVAAPVAAVVVHAQVSRRIGLGRGLGVGPHVIGGGEGQERQEDPV